MCVRKLFPCKYTYSPWVLAAKALMLWGVVGWCDGAG